MFGRTLVRALSSENNNLKEKHWTHDFLCLFSLSGVIAEWCCPCFTHIQCSFTQLNINSYSKVTGKERTHGLCCQQNVWGCIPGGWGTSLSPKMRLWYICSQHPLGSRDRERWPSSENHHGCDQNPDLLRGTPGACSYRLDFCFLTRPSVNDTYCYIEQHPHLRSGWKKGVNDADYERSLADLELNLLIMVSELLWLVRPSAFWEVGENWCGRVCKWHNVTQSAQTYCQELIRDLTRLKSGQHNHRGKLTVDKCQVVLIERNLWVTVTVPWNHQITAQWQAKGPVILGIIRRLCRTKQRISLCQIPGIPLFWVQL